MHLPAHPLIDLSFTTAQLFLSSGLVDVHEYSVVMMTSDTTIILNIDTPDTTSKYWTPSAPPPLNHLTLPNFLFPRFESKQEFIVV